MIHGLYGNDAWKMTAVAKNLTGIGWTPSDANAAEAVLTITVFAAGADEVSTAIAALFFGNARAHQELSAQAAAFHGQFV